MTQIRVATEADAEQACQVVRTSILEVCGPDYGNDVRRLEDWLANKTVDNVRQWLAGDNYTFVAVSSVGYVVGFGMLSTDGEILLCYVAPGALGQGHGHGLLEAMENEARKHGIEELRLSSTTTATGFYQSHGYVNQGDAQQSNFGSSCTPMRKLL